MWAPEIHIVNNKYHVYYSAKNKISGLHALGLAISENPLGPYTGQSFSEVLILASTNPVQYMKITSSEHGVYTNWFSVFVLTFDIYVHNKLVIFMY